MLGKFAAILLLLIISFGSAIALADIAVGSSPSTTGDRVRVWAESESQISKLKTEFGQFFAFLSEHGYNVEFADVRQPGKGIQLVEFEERTTDHLLHFASATKIKVDAAHVLDFANAGGNIIFASSGIASQSLREIAHELGVTFDANENHIRDHRNRITGEVSDRDIRVGAILSKKFADNTHIMPRRSQYASSGISFGPSHAHFINAKNSLINAIWTAEKSARTDDDDANSIEESEIEDGDLADAKQGTEIALVSAMQAKNGARITFVGDINLFSDKTFTFEKAGSRLFVEDITQWTFQENGVVRIANKRLSKIGETELRDGYRIKDNMEYFMELENWNGKERKWQPYQVAQLPFELIMLDPYISTTFTPSPTEKGLHRLNFTLPDKYGVFTFRVRLQEFGLSFLEAKDVLPIRPFRHDEYPRFIFAALPYYVSAWSMILGTLVVCYVWLFAAEPKSKDLKKE